MKVLTADSTMKDLILYTAETRWRRKGGVESYCSMVSRALGSYTDCKVSWFSHDQAYLTHQRIGSFDVTDATKNRMRGAVLAVFQVGKQLGLLNPCITLDPFPLNDKSRAAFDAYTLNRLDFYFKQNYCGVAAALYGVLRDTGARPWTEIARITQEDIDWNNRTLRLSNLKGNGKQQERHVPLTDVAYTALCWQANEIYPKVALFSEEDKRVFLNHWRSVREALNQPNIVPYQLRHTFAMRLLDKGVPIHTVSRMLGHKSINTTMQYVTIRNEDRTAVLHALNEV